MPRALSTALHTAISADEKRPFFAVTLNFARGASPVRLWTGIGDITFGGNTYSGVAQLGQVGGVPETSEIKSTGVQLTLSGVPSALVNDAVWSQYQGDTVNLYFGTRTIENTVQGEPFEMFRGFIDTMETDNDGTTTTITMTVNTIMNEITRSRLSRYTDAEQQRRFPGDKGLEYVASLQNKKITWGTPS